MRIMRGSGVWPTTHARGENQAYLVSFSLTVYNGARARDRAEGATATKDCYVDLPRMAPPRAANHRKGCGGHSEEVARKKMLKMAP